jgi:hypothetical protein
VAVLVYSKLLLLEKELSYNTKARRRCLVNTDIERVAAGAHWLNIKK